MSLPLPSLLRIPFFPPTISSIQILSLPAPLPPPHSRKPAAPRLSCLPLSTSFPYSSFSHRRQPDPGFQDFKHLQQYDIDRDDDEDSVIGDCLVFEEGAFEGGDQGLSSIRSEPRRRLSGAKKQPEPETLVPEKWKEAVAEINLTKKEKRKIAHELKFGSRMERRKPPLPDMEEYRAYRDTKLAQLEPLVLDDPGELPIEKEAVAIPLQPEPEGRVLPNNPKLGLRARGLEDITDFFNSREYVPGEMEDDKKPKGTRKLFTKEEKVLLNKRIPKLTDATSRKWLPLHTLSASGEFYLLDMLMKHNVDINATDQDGLMAIHKAVLSKKEAIVNYLLRQSANPFVRDKDGATLMHYAVQTASSQTIKVLLLYNVDINLPDEHGWTPLHLAVQTKRTDIVRLLLIKGADSSLKNRDGLTPLDLCLYSGHDMRAYELIKLLKDTPKSRSIT